MQDPADPIGDKRKFARITLFNYFVGNCDNHMKNHSFLYSPSWEAARLAPLYDAVSTTLQKPRAGQGQGRDWLTQTRK